MRFGRGSHHREAHSLEVLIEGERVLQAFALHDLKADRIRKAQDSVSVTPEPAVYRGIRHVFVDPDDAAVSGRGERVQEYDSEASREQAVTLGQYKARGDDLTACAGQRRPGSPRAVVPLVARVDERDPGARVYEERRRDRLLRGSASSAACSSCRSARSVGALGLEKAPTSASNTWWKDRARWVSSTSMPRRSASARDTPSSRANLSSVARSACVR